MKKCCVLHFIFIWVVFVCLNSLEKKPGEVCTDRKRSYCLSGNWTEVHHLSNEYTIRKREKDELKKFNYTICLSVGVRKWRPCYLPSLVLSRFSSFFSCPAVAVRRTFWTSVRGGTTGKEVREIGCVNPIGGMKMLVRCGDILRVALILSLIRPAIFHYECFSPNSRRWEAKKGLPLLGLGKGEIGSG